MTERDYVLHRGRLGPLLAVCQGEAIRRANPANPRIQGLDTSQRVTQNHMKHIVNGERAHVVFEGMHKGQVATRNRPAVTGIVDRDMDGTHSDDYVVDYSLSAPENGISRGGRKKIAKNGTKAAGAVGTATTDVHEQKSIAVFGTVPGNVCSRLQRNRRGDIKHASNRGRKKYEVDPEILGAVAIELLGGRDKIEAEHIICTMSRQQLRHAFEMLYQMPTESSNNTWLRNKLLRAIESDGEVQHGIVVHKGTAASLPTSHAQQVKGVVGSGEQRHGVLLEPKRKSDHLESNTMCRRPQRKNQDIAERKNFLECNRGEPKRRGSNSSLSQSDLNDEQQGVVGCDGAIDGKYRCTEHSTSKWHVPPSNGQDNALVTARAKGQLTPYNGQFGYHQTRQDPFSPRDVHNVPLPGFQGPYAPELFTPYVGSHGDDELPPSPNVPLRSKGRTTVDVSEISIPTLRQLSSMMSSIEKQYYAKSIHESLQRIKQSDYDMYKNLVGEVSNISSGHHFQYGSKIGSHVAEQRYPTGLHQVPMCPNMTGNTLQMQHEVRQQTYPQSLSAPSMSACYTMPPTTTNNNRYSQYSTTNEPMRGLNQ